MTDATNTSGDADVREAYARIIDEEPFRTLAEWRERGKVVCGDLGYDWSEVHEALAKRNFEISTRRDGPRKEAALAKADAILALTGNASTDRAWIVGRETGRLAARPWREGAPLPAVGEMTLVSGANCDVESDQHRAFSWRRVIGYGEGAAFICLQTKGCWPTVERTQNCWFATDALLNKDGGAG